MHAYLFESLPQHHAPSVPDMIISLITIRYILFKVAALKKNAKLSIAITPQSKNAMHPWKTNPACC
jgi:hypothetical protein